MIVAPLSTRSTPIERTEHLQRVWGFGVPKEGGIATQEDIVKSYEMIAEELEEMKELIDNFGHYSFSEMDDELSDVIVDMMEYLQQLAVRTGVASRYARDSYAIYCNNLTKVCLTLKEAEETLNKYLDQGVTCYAEPVGSHWVVKRSADHKVMKPAGFVPVTL